ncbi:hypothetical protein DMB66_17810 [Actinoplanes sp. ATCC 53533]|uniref:hypothetical protein n=1 Tax=Actinoplanes sp. ATCC 53533 TaxID=1288362 RepID=UPI000F7960EB|nr:hypothetical protein [Actinoplanes sp. ATCC 53533]RSM65130.1 hypothetical protein DMB66_17810 [Actinoplanes sp. ATCC 53533]
MDSRAEQGAQRGAVELVKTPYVVNVLDSLHHGRQPVPATTAPGEQDGLDLAIQVLVGAGVLAASTEGSPRLGGVGEPALSLTDVGRDVAAIVAELCRKP